MTETTLNFVIMLLLASPFVFLIRKVRKTIALRVAALAVVVGSYLVAVPAVIGAWIMVVADNPANHFVTNVIDQDQMFAGIRFPKGSTVKRFNYGKISDVVLSEDIEINGIPAGKGTTVGFRSDGKVGMVTTGRAWMYLGIPVPTGSTVFMDTSRCAPATPSTATSAAPRKGVCGIYSIDISQLNDAILNVEDMLVRGPAVLEFNGDTLRSLYGDYEWRGDRYKSYRVGVDGQIARQRQ
jgi:hypothetical protein